MDRYNDQRRSSDGLERPNKCSQYKIRGKARAKYNFTAQNQKELSFRKGDTIYLLREIDHNWTEGERHGRVGIFPKNYVEIITSLNEATDRVLNAEGEAEVIYNFRPQTSVELPLRKGDIVKLIRRVDENWWEGRLGKSQGIFPCSYVKTTFEPSTPLTTPTASQAPTPIPGSRPFSPTSSVPTIPTAPQSPNPLDHIDFDYCYEKNLSYADLMTEATAKKAFSSAPSTSRDRYNSSDYKQSYEAKSDV